MSGNRRTCIVVIAVGAALLVILAAAAFSLAFMLPQRNAARSGSSSQAPAITQRATPSTQSTPTSSRTPTATQATGTPTAGQGQPPATPLPVTPFLKYTLTQPPANGWSFSSNAPQSDPYAQRDTFSYPPGATADPSSGITTTPALSMQRTQEYGEIPSGEGYLIGPTMTFQLADATCRGQEDPVLETTAPHTMVILIFCQAYGHNYLLRLGDLAANYSHDATSLFAPFMRSIELVT